MQTPISHRWSQKEAQEYYAFYFKAVDISRKTARKIIDSGQDKPYNISNKRWQAIIKQTEIDRFENESC